MSAAMIEAKLENRDGRNLAYGLLWSITLDTTTPEGKAWSLARTAMLATMTKDDQRAGIEAARTALENGHE
jgi:hypothetical protein